MIMFIFYELEMRVYFRINLKEDRLWYFCHQKADYDIEV